MNAEILRTYLDQYNEAGLYFEPEYKRKNPILTAFHKENPVFTDKLIKELSAILSGSFAWENKLFVADLLYLYKPIHGLLLHPMLNCATELPDPSFNRIFLKPCLTSYGIPIISKMLARKFREADVPKKTRIASLLYWIRPKTDGENKELRNAVLKRAEETSNLVELYFYQRYFSYPLKQGLYIPDDATALIETITGNPAYEDLLFNQLNWKKLS